MCKHLGPVWVRRSKYSLLLWLNLRLRIRRSQVHILTMQQTWDTGSRGHRFEPWSCNKPGTLGQEVAGLNTDHVATSPPPSCWHMHGNAQITHNKGGNSSVGRTSDWKARHNTDRGSSPPCGKGCLTSRRVNFQCTLWASLSGTFLQTLPDLVMPLKGYSLSLCICTATWSAPSERFRY